MNYPIYLDYAASTPLDPKVSQAMAYVLESEELFANPSSLHVYGKKAQAAIEKARAQVADAIGAKPAEIIWTSGATEANNLAIKGVANLYSHKGNHIITAKTEHKAVLDVCQHLEKKGYRVTYLTPMRNGLIDLNELQAAITDATILISLMHVNNETGVVYDLANIAEITTARGIYFHVDAAQSIGKLLLNVNDIPIDLISMCAHKVYGPKGIGALYIRRKPRIRVEPLLHGGGHEQGMRSGTLATHQIIGMGVAFELANEYLQQDYVHATSLRYLFLKELQSISNFKLNCELKYCVPHILNVRFEKMLADALLAKLPEFAASTASACQGKGTEGSYVLKAMGLSLEEIKSAIRFSFGRFTSQADIKKVTQTISQLFA